MEYIRHPGRPRQRAIVAGYEVSLVASKIYDLLLQNPTMSSVQLAQRLRLTPQRIRQCLAELRALGLLKRVTEYRLSR